MHAECFFSVMVFFLLKKYLCVILQLAFPEIFISGTVSFSRRAVKFFFFLPVEKQKKIFSLKCSERIGSILRVRFAEISTRMRFIFAASLRISRARTVIDIFINDSMKNCSTFREIRRIDFHIKKTHSMKCVTFCREILMESAIRISIFFF